MVLLGGFGYRKCPNFNEPISKLRSANMGRFGKYGALSTDEIDFWDSRESRLLKSAV